MQAVETLQQGIDEGIHIGAQLYVSHRGKVVVDIALGAARPGVPMTTDTMMVWFSMTKATTSVAVAQQWEQGNLDIEAPVAHYIPEFAANGKSAVTLRHLLTHTAGIPFADGILEGAIWRESRAENLARIYAAEPVYEPGTRAGYHPAAGMSVLGEIVERVSGVPYEQYVRDNVFIPLGMADCWVGMPETQYDAYGDRIGRMHNTEGDEPVEVRGIDSRRVSAVPIPGGGGRGPMNQLGRLYEALVNEGAGVLQPVTTAAISARHRSGVFDETFQIVVDWGLGLAVDTFAMSRYSSRRAFGHGGARSSIAFCDPEHGLVVAAIFNGMPVLAAHNARLAALSDAVYLDLGLAKPGDPGRDKPFPDAGL